MSRFILNFSHKLHTPRLLAIFMVEKRFAAKIRVRKNFKNIFFNYFLN